MHKQTENKNRKKIKTGKMHKQTELIKKKVQNIYLTNENIVKENEYFNHFLIKIKEGFP